MTNEVAPMLEGEHTDRIVTYLRTIDAQLEEIVTILQKIYDKNLFVVD